MTAPSPLPSLARRAVSLEPSATLAMLARVRALQAGGADILDLTAGEPDFPSPRVAAEAGVRAIQEGRGRYTAAAGMPELREAVAEMLERDLGLAYAPEQVVVSGGAKLAISEALLALVNPGDRVLICAPYWTSYPAMIGLAEGVPVAVACGRDHLPRVEDLEAARDDNTTALILNTPCNPTGAVYPEALLAEIGAWAARHGIWVISDEIYAALTYDGARHVSPMKAAPELAELGVWVGGASKSFAMTGWRIGYLAAQPELAKRIAGLQSQLASCPCSISQVGVLAALRGAAEECEAMRVAFERRCRLVAEGLQAIPGLECPTPQGAFYAFPRAEACLGKADPETGRRIESGDDLVELLLEAEGVAAIGGSAFGDPAAFRLSFAAADEVLEEALRRIRGRVQRLT